MRREKAQKEIERARAPCSVEAQEQRRVPCSMQFMRVLKAFLTNLVHAPSSKTDVHVVVMSPRYPRRRTESIVKVNLGTARSYGTSYPPNVRGLEPRWACQVNPSSHGARKI